MGFASSSRPVRQGTERHNQRRYGLRCLMGLAAVRPAWRGTAYRQDEGGKGSGDPGEGDPLPTL
ncbi:hypothetical protein GCM10010341_78660 [Streptomyces noursei]|nr:hypothetical protein GCM10010341_78660 [Streptomyces noursei]